MRAYILRYLINNVRLVKVGTTQAQRKLFFNLVKEKNIQLFISTHSEECIESFSKVAKLAESEIIRKDLRILTLEHNLFNEFNTIICKTSDFEIIDNGLSNGFDFRGGLWAHD